MTSPLHKKITTRGYWQVVIRPATLVEDRIVDYSQLFPLVEKNRVKLRGWDFPHIDYKAPVLKGPDWIGQEIEWQYMKDEWRFFQSGQFVQIMGIPLDWRDALYLWQDTPEWKAGTLVGIGDTIGTLTEIFEFAARLALSEAGDEAMHIEFSMHHLKDRSLYMDSGRDRWPLLKAYKTSMDKYAKSFELERSQLVSDAKALASQAAIQFFKRFDFDIDSNDVESWQDEININR